jgi:hypothetical protein
MRARLLLVVALLSPTAALAQYAPPPPPPNPPPPPPYYHPYGPRGPREWGPTIGGRIGLGLPYGSISNEGEPSLDSVIGHKIPIWLELGYRFNRAVRTNLFFELAPATVSSSICSVGSCDAMDWRLGADLQFHLAPYVHQVDPWIGVGFGYEWLSFQSDAVDPVSGAFLGRGDFHYRGWEIVLFEGGLDFPLSRVFSVGPYLSWSLAQFAYVDTSTPAGSVSSSIFNQATHSWLEIGLKGTFKL